MNEPFPEMKISIRNETNFKYSNSSFDQVVVSNNRNEVNSYEYETELNESYRNILILKPEYLGLVVEEFKNIMNYDKSTETINNKLKRVNNPKIVE